MTGHGCLWLFGVEWVNCRYYWSRLCFVLRFAFYVLRFAAGRTKEKKRRLCCWYWTYWWLDTLLFLVGGWLQLLLLLLQLLQQRLVALAAISFHDCFATEDDRWPLYLIYTFFIFFLNLFIFETICLSSYRYILKQVYLI